MSWQRAKQQSFVETGCAAEWKQENLKEPPNSTKKENELLPDQKHHCERHDRHPILNQTRTRCQWVGPLSVAMPWMACVRAWRAQTAQTCCKYLFINAGFYTFPSGGQVSVEQTQIAITDSALLRRYGGPQRVDAPRALAGLITSQNCEFHGL